MGVFYIRGVPDQLHREAKAAAAKAGMTLQDWVVEAVREKLDKEDK